MKNKNILLGINIDHAANVRQARYRDLSKSHGQMIEPDPLDFAFMVERAGADGITVHLREDRRHIQDKDVIRLRDSIRTRLNLEMGCTKQMIDFALKIKPDTVCLVPENREEITTEGGLNVLEKAAQVGKAVKALEEGGIHVSLFIDPDIEQLDKAVELKASMVELHTGAFANKYYTQNCEEEFNRLIDSANHAHAQGLIVNAGHGINYINIAQICQIPWLHELNIGHSIISRALFTGIGEAVREMKTLMNTNSRL